MGRSRVPPGSPRPEKQGSRATRDQKNERGIVHHTRGIEGKEQMVYDEGEMYYLNDHLC